MGVLFGERGNSFISFFQQSAAGQHGATATEERGVQPRIKRNYIAFVSSDRKQLRVNKRRGYEEEVKTKGKKKKGSTCWKVAAWIVVISN